MNKPKRCFMSTEIVKQAILNDMPPEVAASLDLSSLETEEDHIDRLNYFKNAIKRTELYRTAFMFALGDLCNRMERRFAIEVGNYADIDELGFSPKTLYQVAYVARRFEPSRRNFALSFEHHRVIAPAPPEKQDLFLKQAQEEQLSTAELRRRYAMDKKGEKDIIVKSFSGLNEESILAWGNDIFLSTIKSTVDRLTDNRQIDEILAKAARYLAIHANEKSITQTVARNTFYQFYLEEKRRPTLSELFERCKDKLPNISRQENLYRQIHDANWSFFLLKEHVRKFNEKHNAND